MLAPELERTIIGHRKSILKKLKPPPFPLTQRMWDDLRAYEKSPAAHADYLATELQYELLGRLDDRGLLPGRLRDAAKGLLER